MEQKNNVEKKPSGVAIGFVVVLFIIMFWIGIPAVWNSSKQPDAVAQPTEQKKTYSDFDVYFEAQEILKKALKSPSTADFPSSRDAVIERYADDGFKVRSYVDAQNSFGAMLRSDWTVVFQYVGDNVKVLQIVLDGEELYRNTDTK